MNKFSFGDKVRTLRGNSGFNLKPNAVGVVIKHEGSSVLCLFDDYQDGHFAAMDFRGAAPRHGGPFLYMDPTNIETANPPMVVADAEAPVKKATKRRVYGVKKDGSLNPQSKLVLKLMTDKGSVTSVEASAVYRVRALPRRIADLKAAGHKISRVLSKDATGQRYARYYLAA